MHHRRGFCEICLADSHDSQLARGKTVRRAKKTPACAPVVFVSVLSHCAIGPIENNTAKVAFVIDYPPTLVFDKLIAAVTTPTCGAEVLFVGTTRQWTGTNETTFLEYDSYTEMALAVLQKLEAEAHSRWPIERVAIVHRLGRVDICEASVAVAVGAAHRDAAFEAARWLIDEIKVNVPIWKREHGQVEARWVHPQ